MYTHICRLTCLDMDCKAHSQNALNTSANTNIRSTLNYAVIVVVNVNASGSVGRS